MLLEDILITSINFVCFCMGVSHASPALWEENRLRVFENRVLRIFKNVGRHRLN